MSNNYATGKGDFINVDGNLVESDALRVAEAIKAYDPNLEILCFDPNYTPDISEAPFVIAERCKDGVLRPVLRAWCLNDLVLERIKASDTNRLNPLQTINDWEAQAKKERVQRYEEFRAEAKDITEHIAGMKSKYSVRDSRTGEKITFFDDRPAVRS